MMMMKEQCICSETQTVVTKRTSWIWDETGAVDAAGDGVAREAAVGVGGGGVGAAAAVADAVGAARARIALGRVEERAAAAADAHRARSAVGRHGAHRGVAAVGVLGAAAAVAAPVAPARRVAAPLGWGRRCAHVPRGCDHAQRKYRRLAVRWQSAPKAKVLLFVLSLFGTKNKKGK